jgi:hypothetical protein
MTGSRLRLNFYFKYYLHFGFKTIQLFALHEEKDKLQTRNISARSIADASFDAEMLVGGHIVCCGPNFLYEYIKKI